MSKKRALKSKLIPVSTSVKPEKTEEEYPRFSVPPMTMSFALGCFVTLLLPFYASGFWPAALDLMAGAALAPQALFLGITAGVCLFVGMAGRAADEVRPKSDVEFFLVIFLAWFAFSLLTASYRHDAILETARVGGVLCWFFLVREWFRKLPQEKFVAHLLCFLACIIIGALIVAIPALIDFVQTRNPRQFGTFYNPNLLANFCAMAIPLAAGAAFYATQLTGKFQTAGKVLSALFALAATVILGGLLVTSSKGGLLALFIAAIVFAIALKKARSTHRATTPQRKILLYVGGAVLLLAAGVLLSLTVLPRLGTSLQDDHSSMFRWFTWIATAKMATARPFLGWGPGSFPGTFPLFAIAGYTRSAHQSWLQLAAENGWPAMILLLIACGAAWRGGWRALRGPHFAVAAGALAALIAFAVHGLVDAGWGIISIGWLLMLVLAILATVEVLPETPATVEKATSLNWPWLAGALVLGGLSWVTQRAAQGEDWRAQSIEEMQTAPQNAAATAKLAINSDPASVRLWTNLARIQWSLGDDARAAYRKAISLQPLRAASYFDLARYLQNSDPVKNRQEISRLYDQAILYDKHDTTLRMARAEWKIKHEDATGWDDLRYIVQLLNQPYGKYPAVPEIVDFNYGAAAIMLATHALEQGDAVAARPFLAIAATELEKERQYVNSAYQQQILESVGKTTNEDRQKLAQMEVEYEELLKRAAALEQGSANE